MERFGMLTGIGLMLMGACGIALTPEPDWWNLIPAMVGVVIGTASIATAHAGKGQRLLIEVNGAASVPVFMFSLARIGPDAAKAATGSLAMIPDIEMLGLSSILLFLWALEVSKNRMLKTQKLGISVRRNDRP